MNKPDQTNVSMSEAVQIHEQAIQREEQAQKQLDQTLTEAREDVMSRIFDEDEPFSYNDIEEIMHGHGLEMDYIEDFL